ncbi:MAG: nucleoside kinase, partial [Sphaerochaetaceae bacterium]|nr:nucleoside kinase [Sphaerochaetaceae bacterium]
MFNSALDYELGVLSPFVVPLLHEVSPDSGDAYTHAQRLLEFLENIYPIPSYYVPSDSILREFIGDSDYED